MVSFKPSCLIKIYRFIANDINEVCWIVYNMYFISLI